MSVTVIYSTEAFSHRNGGRSGTQTKLDFASLDEAKAATFPKGYTFAFIDVETGYYVYHSDKFGWEFLPK
jgi:hypothetical protein